MRAPQITAAMLALTACTGATVPETYHGRAGRTVLAVPSRVAGSVLYEGESDWTAPEKPKSEHTETDPIRVIEFYVDLDHPGTILSDDAAVARRSEIEQVRHLPSVAGAVIGITVDLPAERQPSAATIRTHFSIGRMYPGPAFRALKPAPEEFGLETRHADWSKAVAGRTLHGGGIFDVDVDYLSAADDIYIFCNDARQSVLPFAPMATCQFVIVDPALGGRMSGSIDRGDVTRWRDLRSAALMTLRSFVMARPSVSAPERRRHSTGAANLEHPA